MAWEWSHTNEAYDNARKNLAELPTETLAEIAAEIDERDGLDVGLLGTLKDHALERLGREGREGVVEEIWDFAENQSTCDNGGHNAWVCPHGCHTVPFSALTD